ncbi:MAG: hypothetical protein F4X40_00010, partial [Chloroflexi bacterium]|nr:hypothetical protein [Chloroflexota bacterium]
AVVFLQGDVRTSAQETPNCEVIDLGTLGSDSDGGLSTEGRWSTEDCDSSFHVESDAHNYQFAVAEAGRIRIELKSSDADAFLYLLDGDGNRITDNDDGGGNLDARIERDLAPGSYLLEATTVGGRRQGAADFSLSINWVEGCESEHLGSLEPGTDLTATGTWTFDTCGSRFVVQHPAFGYTFEMKSGGRVLIDLRSPEGDPVLSLISPTRGLIAANDDGGERRNSRIERYLEAGTYLVEATTYLERDALLILADFELVIHLVDEAERQASGFQMKIETVEVPERVTVGVPFEVHYRVGNVGNGTMTEDDGSVRAYAVALDDWGRADLTIDPETGWPGGVSYHTSDATANSTSTESDDVNPFELTLEDSGNTWVWLYVVTDDPDGEEIGFHIQWRELTVLSGLEFDETTVSVDEVEYRVSSETDDEGEVTVLVSQVEDPEAEVDATVRAKAIYTAGFALEYLDGIFDREAIADLRESEEMATVSVFDPSSQTLSIEFAKQFSEVIADSDLDDRFADGVAAEPQSVEDLILSSADQASAQYSAVASSWRRIADGVATGNALWYSEAKSVHSQLAYAERVIAPMVEAGRIVDAARAAEDGWDDEDVQSMVDEFSGEASCRGAGSALRESLESAGVGNVDELMKLDTELRAASRIYGLAINAVVCATMGADADNRRFLDLLSPADSAELKALLEPVSEPAATLPRLRIIARLVDDGRIEHGVEFSDGEQVMPDVRYLAGDATPGVWHTSSDVELDENPIGKIRTRRLADGRVELGFVNTGGEAISPEIRFLSADLASGIWIRSSEIEVPAETTLSE